MGNIYDARSIKILTPEEAETRFPFAMAERLYKQYLVPMPCINRGLETCLILGIKFSYYEDKYLAKRDVETIPEFEVVYKELLQSERR